MRILQLLSALTLVLLLGCEQKPYEPGNALMVQTNPNAAPYSVKVISKQQDSYTVEVFSDRKVISVPNYQIVRQITDAGQEDSVVSKWEENKANLANPQYQAQLKLDQKVKTQCFFYGFLPLLLFAIACLCHWFWLAAAPYFFVCIMIDPFTFFCILFFFFFVSAIAWAGCTFLMSGFGVNVPGMIMGTLCYFFIVFMFFTTTL